MATNKVATVVLLDVGLSVSQQFEDETFFKKSQWCLLRMIQRAIFSGENDEMAVVLFGCKNVNNHLAIISADGDNYNNVCGFISLQKPNWDMYEKVQSLTTTEMDSNWIEGLVAGLEFLKIQIKGKRFKDRQVVVLSNFVMELEFYADKIGIIADSINYDNIKLVVIGLDLEEECKGKEIDSQLSGSLGMMFPLLEKVENGVSLSFLEAEDNIQYYEKKKKMGRFTKVNLTIGTGISIPIRWIKLNLEPTRIKWMKKPSARQNAESGKNDVPEIKYVMEMQKETKFGDTKVVMSYADLEAMKRETGPPSCILLGCVKRQRIRREMLIGKDLYLVVAEKAPREQAMLAAFIDALIDADKYGLVRRVTTNNGKVKLGILVPVSDEIGKVLYFLQLPFAEYSMVVPDVRLSEPNNEQILEAFDNLIDAMTITDKPKELPMRDPTFQLRCHILQLYQTGQLNKDTENPLLPEFIQKLCNPYPELLENGLTYIEQLEKMLPIQIVDEQSEVKIASQNIKINLKIDEDMITEQADKKKIQLNKSIDVDDVNVDELEDWEEADTQEWSSEMKNKYKVVESVSAPSLQLKEEMLLKNKYDRKYISERLWKEHGANDDEDEEILSSAYSEALDMVEMLPRLESEVDLSTDEAMEKIRRRESE